MAPTSGQSRKLLRAVALAAVLLAICAGCQESSVGVGVVNRCGVAVEVGGNSTPETAPTGNWKGAAKDAHVHVVDIGTHETDTRIFVRAKGAKPGKSFVVAVADMSKAPKGSGSDLEVVIEGERCPVPSGG
jgi:hypothetical protein